MRQESENMVQVKQESDCLDAVLRHFKEAVGNWEDWKYLTGRNVRNFEKALNALTGAHASFWLEEK